MDHAATLTAERPQIVATPVRLNPVDQLILLTEREIRRRGLPAFTCQIHAWFRGRLDLAELRAAIADVVARWPLLTARLVERPVEAWQLTDDRTCPLRETLLTSDDEATFVAAASKLLVEPFDITRAAPVRFVVQHRPGGNDVLTMQYSHVLMDGHGAIGLMNELLDGVTSVASESERPPARAAEPARRSLWQRWRQFRARQRQARTVPVTFPLPPDQPLGGRLLLRWIDADAYQRLRTRIARAGMTANLSLAFVASGFRVIARRLSHRLGPRSVLETALRYNTRAGHVRDDYFLNQFSRVTLAVRPDELDDREALIRKLASQFRQQFRTENREVFLQSARFAARLSRWTPRVNRWLLRRAVTLTVGSFAEVGRPGQTAFGATVEGGFLHPVPFLQSPVIVDVFPVGPRLLASLTYCTTAVSDEDARRLFDDWLNDLLAP